MLKIGHLAKPKAFSWAIAYPKYSISGRNLNYLKHVKKESLVTLE